MNKDQIKRWSKIFALLCLFSSPWWAPHLLWRAQDAKALRVVVVDYTVPFDNYTEHVGLMWLLNHLKIPAPGGQDTWEPARDYVGYDPTDREHPRRLEEASLENVDWIYISDTYGVYHDDLEGIETYSAHMDFNEPVFAGLSRGDVRAMERHVDRGGSLFLEFNSFCAPTEASVRRRAEQLVGVRWTGWVGRYFLDLYKTEDVPHWLPRLFAEQFPGQELPREPTLVLMDRSARLLLLPSRDKEAVMPLIELTHQGRQRYGDFPAAPYFNWFAVTRERPGSQVLARMLLPEDPVFYRKLKARGLPHEFAFLVETRRGASRSFYVGGDFSEVDFDPGWYSMWGIVALQRWLHSDTREVSARSAFWGFFAPVLRQTLASDPRALKAP